MKIVIDLQGAQSHSRFRGIGRYSLALAIALAKTESAHEIIIALNGMFPETIDDIRKVFYGLIDKQNIKVWKGCAPTHYSDEENKNRISTNTLIYESFLASLHPDIVLTMSAIEGYTDNSISAATKRYRLPQAVIFYDAIPYMQVEKYIKPLGKRFETYYYEKIDNIKNAVLLFGISQSSCNEAIDVLKIPKKKLVNIYAAVSDYFKPLHYTEEEKVKTLTSLNIDKKFILYSGATDERKNHLRLIKAFSLLPNKYQEEYQLVIAGGMPEENKLRFKAYIKQCNLNTKQVIFTNRVSDAELRDLYNLCELYVFPSYHEGFGLPALEAMQCGAATIGANTTSVPEVIGREDALFDPFDEEAIAEKIEEVLSNETFRENLKKHSLIQAKKFSWDKSAKKVIAGLEQWYTKNKQHYHKSDTNYTENLIDDIVPIQNSKDDLLYISEAIAFNHPKKNEKQLLIDISELVQHDAKSGIQRVVRSILQELFANPPQEYIPRAVYANTDTLGYKYADTFISSFLHQKNHSDIIDHTIDIHAGDIFLGLDMSPNVQIYQENYLKKLQNLGVYVHFVVYDLLLIHHPEWWPNGVEKNFRKWLNVVISVSDNICCISQAVANDVEDYIENIQPTTIKPHVSYFHLGADIDSSVPSKGLESNSKAILEKIKNNPSFLMVGTLEPRKGHAQTLDAFETLWDKGIEVNLVIVGKSAWMVDKLVQRIYEHPKLHTKLFWLERISDEYLEKVYKNCTCLLSASEGEGFGLPLIEAAQKNLPIIARDIPVFREVAGEHAYYFENIPSSDSLSQTILNWLALYKENIHPKSNNMPWLTWKQSSKELLNSILLT